VKEIDVMTARALFGRALAAVAVTGIAIAGTASGAGAATSHPTPIISVAPGGVTVDLGAHTVVTVGGPHAPRPGVHVAAVGDGRANAVVGNPATALAPVAAPAAPVVVPVLAPATPLVGGLPASAHLLDADVAAHVCLVATLFSGDAGSCTIPHATSTSGSPSVADAMGDAMLCARVAVLGSDSFASCDAQMPAGPDAVVPSSVVAHATDAQACATATVLGTADPSRCDGSDVSGDPTGSGGTTGTGSDADGPDGTSAAGTTDVCAGLVLLASTDRPCTAGDPTSATPGVSPIGTVATGLTGTPPVVADASTRAGSTGDAGNLAFTGADTLVLTLVGLGTVAGGLAMRRASRVGTVG
jgi:hypothetical protein